VFARFHHRHVEGQKREGRSDGVADMAGAEDVDGGLLLGLARKACGKLGPERRIDLSPKYSRLPSPHPTAIFSWLPRAANFTNHRQFVPAAPVQAID